MIDFDSLLVWLKDVWTVRPRLAPTWPSVPTWKFPWREAFPPTATVITVWVLVSTVCEPMVPSVTYQPLKWVIVGITWVDLMNGCRRPRSSAVQASPSLGSAVGGRDGFRLGRGG